MQCWYVGTRKTASNEWMHSWKNVLEIFSLKICENTKAEIIRDIPGRVDSCDLWAQVRACVCGGVRVWVCLWVFVRACVWHVRGVETTTRAVLLEFRLEVKAFSVLAQDLDFIAYLVHQKYVAGNRFSISCKWTCSKKQLLSQAANFFHRGVACKFYSLTIS